ncbi:hypothetical protein F4778DRAFT_799863 [Xylariomycetidae sp. FL2044]|nr:hypothetical protein F4778DRAFT_799863 [Xylariomycetidae sp. FL2044]
MSSDLTSFHLFPELPKDLREKILLMALAKEQEGRVIPYEPATKKIVPTRTLMSPFLSVNRLYRELALGTYQFTEEVFEKVPLRQRSQGGGGGMTRHFSAIDGKPLRPGLRSRGLVRMNYVTDLVAHIPYADVALKTGVMRPILYGSRNVLVVISRQELMPPACGVPALGWDFTAPFSYLGLRKKFRCLQACIILNLDASIDGARIVTELNARTLQQISQFLTERGLYVQFLDF